MIINVYALFIAEKSTYYVWTHALVNWAPGDWNRVTQVAAFIKISSVLDQSERKKK